jgi:paraquat-inducible protein B
MADAKKLIKDSIQNIEDDRKLTVDLLNELRSEIQSGETNHSRSGAIAAKYVETLQRSNEQLVKLANMLAKQRAIEEDLTLSNEETDDLFKVIQGAKLEKVEEA